MDRSDVRKPIDYLAIGHVTHDILPDASYLVGGTVSYAALTAAAFQRKVGILTSAGRDFDPAPFSERASFACNLAPRTTTFRNRYVNGSRHQVVYGVADLLTPAHVPEEWSAPLVAHIGPVIDECQPDLVDQFSDSTFIGITPQGWMRSTNGDGKVHRHPWYNAAEMLSCASAVVFSIDDVQGNWDLARDFARQTKLLVVTTGADGGVLFVDGVAESFPALEVSVADPTGAGDIFAAVFFSALVSQVQPRDAARFAACVASRSVTRVGLEGVPGPEDIAVCRARTGVDF